MAPAWFGVDAGGGGCIAVVSTGGLLSHSRGGAGDRGRRGEGRVVGDELVQHRHHLDYVPKQYHPPHNYKRFLQGGICQIIHNCESQVRGRWFNRTRVVCLVMTNQRVPFWAGCLEGQERARIRRMRTERIGHSWVKTRTQQQQQGVVLCEREG